jgi:hypothetical protein
MSPSDTPDFENMSPDEMMRWMESLARRQGANAEEFVTSADDEINEIDESTFVDESPGYVPYGEKAPPKPEPTAAKPEPEPEPPAPAPQPVAAGGSGGMDFDNMSPDEMMRWMESLAKRQGANAEELLTTADADIDEVDESTYVDNTPGYVPFGQTPPARPAPRQPSQPEPPAPQPQPVTGDDMDFLASLAAGDSGADLPDFASLGADLSDLPDFSDLDALAADLDLGGEMGTSAGGDTDAMAWLEGLTSSQPQPEPPTAANPKPSEEVTNPLDAGTDPMAWLEGLARNQGAKDEELFTGGRIPPSSAPPPSVLEETAGPGYEPYSVDDEGMDDASDPAAWLQGLAGTDAVGEPAEEPVLDASDPAAWLGQLAGTDEDTAPEYVEEDAFEDASDPAAWLGDLMNDTNVTSRVPGFDPNPPTVRADRPSTGDPIADMLNRGETPSPEAMQAWMSGKMDELMSQPPLPIDEDDEEDAAPPAFDPDAPAVPGDIPDWLTGMAPADDADAVESAFNFDPDAVQGEADMFSQSPVTDAFDAKHEGSFAGDDFTEAEQQVDGMPDFLSMTDAAPGEDFFGTGLTDGEPSPLRDEIETPPDVVDMPDWLRQDVPMGGDSLMDIFDTAEDEAVPADTTPQSTEIDTDLVARLTPEGGAFEQDPWVQALREEQQYNYQTDSLPDWYEQRISDPNIRAKFEQLDARHQTLAAANLPVESDLPPGQREPLPDWFNRALGAAPPTPAFDTTPDVPTGSVPDWLLESVDGGPSSSSGDLPDWLMTDADAGSSDIPAWLTETLPEDAPQPEPEPEPQRPVPQPQRQPQLAPQPARQVTPAPQQSPVPVPQSAQIDVAATLQDAQQRQGNGDIDGALQRYEQVVRANAQLGAVESAMKQILGQKEHKANPAAHRVLGDSLMRQGKLQAALDTYRKALNLL